MATDKATIIGKLRQDILKLEGYKAPAPGTHNLVGLGPVETVFPNGVFPVAAVHEIVCASSEQVAAAGGFVTGILSVLMKMGGVCVWIGRSRRMFAPSLQAFGVLPQQVIFISLAKDKDALWVMEEALKCAGLTAVICELREMDAKQSRRLQAAIEHSRVTGFVMRNASKHLSSTVCAARWQIKPVRSADLDGLPGLGFPRWQVELLKVRNGQTGSWVLEWADSRFHAIEAQVFQEERQVG